MKDEKLSLARLAVNQLNHRERQALARELGIMDERVAPATPIAANCRLLRRAEVAQRLAVSPRTVDNWARQGFLNKRRLPGRKRACGFNSAEVEKLIVHGIARD
jgi:predicted DNA-binding transcriptional regulator AlpA